MWPNASLAFVLDQLGTRETQISEHAFATTVDDILRASDCLPTHGRRPGFTAYAENMRTLHLQDIIISDAGDINVKRRCAVHLPCQQPHPGFCATRDGWLLAPARSAAAGLHSYLKEFRSGTCFRLRARVEASDGICHMDASFARGYRREGGLRLDVVCDLTFDEDTCELSMDGDEIGFHMKVMVSVIARFFSHWLERQPRSLTLRWHQHPCSVRLILARSSD